LKREKIELENTLEKEQESLVNRLWKRMEKLETDKRLLQQKLEQSEHSIECTPSSSSGDSGIINRTSSVIVSNDDNLISRSNSLFTSNRLSLPNVDHIQQLKKEVEKLKRELVHTQESHRQKMDELVKEEQDVRNENLRLQRKLQLEVDRREQLCRQLSESESSLEMDEERALNERIKAFPKQQRTSSNQQHSSRVRTVSSPSSNNNLINENNSNDFQRPRPPSTSLDTTNQME
jgi:coiled-coil domain-containing protein 6